MTAEIMEGIRTIEREKGIEAGTLVAALEDALQLVHLYAERGSPKYEKAALRWLERYLTESSPRLRHFAEVARDLAKLDAREPN